MAFDIKDKNLWLPKENPFFFYSLDRGVQLPKMVEIKGKNYFRFLDRFLIPQKMTRLQIQRLFSFLSDKYEKIADLKIKKKVLETLIKLVLPSGSSSKTKILDYGCGTGLSAIVWNEMQLEGNLFGCDITSRMLKTAIRRGIKAELVTNNKIPFEASFFDGVFLSYVSFLLRFPEIVFSEIKRVLRQKGKLAFNTYKIDENYDYRNLLAKLGFKNIRVKEIVIDGKKLKIISAQSS